MTVLFFNLDTIGRRMYHGRMKTKSQSKLKQRIDEIRNDQALQYALVAAVIMTICHVYMYIDSDHQIEPLIRICYCAIFFIMMAILGKKWIPFQFLIVGFSIMYFNKWNNVTSFLLVAAVAMRYPKYKKTLLISYGVAVAICLCIAHRNWAHAVLHVIYCGGVYCLLMYIRKSFSDIHQPKLTSDEEEILAQMAQGKMKKEVVGYSKNTITVKVAEAMKRNGCSSEGELIFRYKYLGKSEIKN